MQSIICYESYGELLNFKINSFTDYAPLQVHYWNFKRFDIFFIFNFSGNLYCKAKEFIILFFFPLVNFYFLLF